MSYQTFTRSYLQGLPEMEKQRYLDCHLEQVIQTIRHKAIEGKTSYTYVPDWVPLRYGLEKGQNFTYTTDDYIRAFKGRLPDCDVSYQEKWVDVSPMNRILQKGIVIDWS